MPERLKAILDKITAWWKKFNTKQRSVLISIVAVVIVALVILGVVISRPTQVENDADLAKELSISEDELCSWQSQLKVTNVVSLDEFDESGPEPVMDAAHNSHYAQPEEIVTQEELKTMLVKSLDNLTEKERRVIELYYYEDLTLKEISNILEVSESRVSQLHTKGLIKMRKVMGPYMNILTNA